MKDIPTQDPEAFDKWLLERWREKDDLIEQFLDTGRFPPSDADDKSANGPVNAPSGSGYIETPIRAKSPLEYLQIYAPLGIFFLLIRLIRQVKELLLVRVGTKGA